MSDEPRAAESLQFKAGYAAAIGDMGRGVQGPTDPDIWPDWVYEAREAIRHANNNLPWLPDLLRILGWQGGTVHQAMQAVSRLVAGAGVAGVVDRMDHAEMQSVAKDVINYVHKSNQNVNGGSNRAAM